MLAVISAAGLRIAMPQTPLSVAQAIVDGAVIRCMAAGGTPSDADIVALKRLIGVLPALESTPESGDGDGDDGDDEAGEEAEVGGEADVRSDDEDRGEQDTSRSLIDPPTGTRYQVEFLPPSLIEVA